MKISELIKVLQYHSDIGLTDVYIGEKYDIKEFHFNDDRNSVDLMPNIPSDKNEIFTYLVENRIFLKSLSDNDIKRYYKLFKSIHKDRIKENIKLTFAMLFRSYRDI